MALDPKSYQAIATMRIGNNVKLPDDSSAAVQSAGLMGEKFIAIEPGVYVPGVGGVRNEDDLVVWAKDGAKSLQSIPHAVSVNGSRR